MKLTAWGAFAFMLLTIQASGAAKPLPKDCPREFVKVWNARSYLKALPEPKEPCVMHGETGIYVCDHGCVRP